MCPSSFLMPRDEHSNPVGSLLVVLYYTSRGTKLVEGVYVNVYSKRKFIRMTCTVMAE